MDACGCVCSLGVVRGIIIVCGHVVVCIRVLDVDLCVCVWIHVVVCEGVVRLWVDVECVIMLLCARVLDICVWV